MKQTTRNIEAAEPILFAHREQALAEPHAWVYVENLDVNVTPGGDPAVTSLDPAPTQTLTAMAGDPPDQD